MPGAHDRALGQAIRQLRTARNLTQEKLASNADLTIATVTRMELAQGDPNWPTVRAVIQALGATWTEFGEAMDAAQ
jgi:transcriptional regulator with XRE-family HTH domain